MRILIINSEYPPLGGGAGNASANLARSLAAKGQDVAVMTVQFPGLLPKEIQNGVLVHRIWALRKHMDRSGATEQLSFIFSGAIHALPFVHSWKPDKIIAFFGVPSGAITWLIRWIFGVPYIVSLRGGDVPGFRPYDFGTYHRLMSPFLRQIWRKAGAVVANSNGLRELGNAFDPQTTIEIIPNGVDIEQFQPVEREWNPGKLLFVGRLVYQKGLDILLNALGNLMDLDWQLTLVGDGNQCDKLIEQSKSLGIFDRIHFTGWLMKNDLVEQYKHANLYVAPSRHEGMPNVVLEAMASGLPIVATKIAGHEELVAPGVNGWLVPGDHPEALHQSLRKILTNPEKQKAMGAASRLRVEAFYTWDSTAQQYLEILQNMEVNLKKVPN